MDDIETPTRNRRNRRLGVAVALVTLLSAGVGTAQARPVPYTEPCALRDESAVFRRFGDDNSYFLVPAGNFEHGLSAWKVERLTVERDRLDNAAIVAVNEPFGLRGSGTSNSMRVSTAFPNRSVLMCVRANEETLRFAYRNSGLAGSALEVTISQLQGPPAPTGLVVSRPDTSAAAPSTLAPTTAAPRAEVTTYRFEATPGKQEWAITPILRLERLYNASGKATMGITFRAVPPAGVTGCSAGTSYPIPPAPEFRPECGEWLVDGVYVDPFRSR